MASQVLGFDVMLDEHARPQVPPLRRETETEKQAHPVSHHCLGRPSPCPTTVERPHPCRHCLGQSHPRVGLCRGPLAAQLARQLCSPLLLCSAPNQRARGWPHCGRRVLVVVVVVVVVGGAPCWLSARRLRRLGKVRAGRGARC